MPFFISDFYNLKIVNNIFFFIFKGDLIFSNRGVYNTKRARANLSRFDQSENYPDDPTN